MGTATLQHPAPSPAYDPRYEVWRGMLQRCLNPAHQAYARYGGRGITVCNRWRRSFADFCADVGQRPDGGTLDRIDNDRGYEPGNVRWVTRQAQAQNRRDNRVLTAFGKSRCIIEWARELGVSYQAIDGRLRRGWTLERAVSVPRQWLPKSERVS